MDDENYLKYLQKYVDEVLHYIWDPIGMSDVPEARDEYSSYADSIYRAIIDGKTAEDITKMLTDFEGDRMGLEITRGVKQRNERVAELVLDWSRYLKDDMSLQLLEKG